MTAGAIRQYYNRLLHSIGIRKEKQKRHQFSVHGYRKAYKTICELAGMKPINIEILLNHTVGISDSYFRPTETQLLDDYLSVSDKLTVNDIVELRRENEQEFQQLRQSDAEKTKAISELQQYVKEIHDIMSEPKKLRALIES